MGLLLLPLCVFVSARPQDQNLVVEDILERGSQSEDSKVRLDVDQAFDRKIDVGEAIVNNSDLVQSMALSCPPPVATFLRFGDKVELDNPLLLPDIWSLCVKAFEHLSFLFQS